jgi:phosphoglycolate phosphatase
MPKRLILYDLDGTLVDTREDILSSVRHMLASMGRPPMPDAAIAGYVGHGLPYLIGQVLGTDDQAAVAEGLRRYREHYAQHMLDHTRLYPDAQVVLEFFAPRPQAVVTNKTERSSRVLLDALRVDRHFQAVIGGDSGFPYKPDPAGVRSLLARFGVAPRDALFIGDSVVDLDTGRNAGVPTVIVLHGFGSREQLAAAAAAAEQTVADFNQLLLLARRSGW